MCFVVWVCQPVPGAFRCMLVVCMSALPLCVLCTTFVCAVCAAAYWPVCLPAAQVRQGWPAPPRPWPVPPHPPSPPRPVTPGLTLASAAANAVELQLGAMAAVVVVVLLGPPVGPEGGPPLRAGSGAAQRGGQMAWCVFACVFVRACVVCAVVCLHMHAHVCMYVSVRACRAGNMKKVA